VWHARASAITTFIIGQLCKNLFYENAALEIFKEKHKTPVKITITGPERKRALMIFWSALPTGLSDIFSPLFHDFSVLGAKSACPNETLEIPLF